MNTFGRFLLYILTPKDICLYLLHVYTQVAHTCRTLKGADSFEADKKKTSRFLSYTQKLDQKENKPKKAFMNLVLQLKASVLSIEHIQKVTDCWTFHS